MNITVYGSTHIDPLLEDRFRTALPQDRPVLVEGLNPGLTGRFNIEFADWVEQREQDGPTEKALLERFGTDIALPEPVYVTAVVDNPGLVTELDTGQYERYKDAVIEEFDTRCAIHDAAERYLTDSEATLDGPCEALAVVDRALFIEEDLDAAYTALYDGFRRSPPVMVAQYVRQSGGSSDEAVTTANEIASYIPDWKGYRDTIIETFLDRPVQQDRESGWYNTIAAHDVEEISLVIGAVHALDDPRTIRGKLDADPAYDVTVKRFDTA